jgi:hypothetical protein
MLQGWKLRSDITNMHVWQITPDSSVGKHDEICEETDASKLSPPDLCVRQLPPHHLELLAGFIEQHIKDCPFK